MYRAALGAASPRMRDECDATATGYGETWVAPRVVTAADDDWLTPADAADYLCVSVAEVRRLRLAGRLTGTKDGDQWRYRVADLRALQTATRRRNRPVADRGA